MSKLSKSQALRDLVRHAVLVAALVGTAGWAIHWFVWRTPEADWRIFMVGMLLASVLGWWPFIQVGTTSVLAVCALIWTPEPDMRLQLAGEIIAFGSLGLAWGILCRLQLQPAILEARRQRPEPPASDLFVHPKLPKSPEPNPSAPSRSNKLMDGNFDDMRSARSSPHQPAPIVPQNPVPISRTPVQPLPFQPISSPSSSHVPIWETPEESKGPDLEADQRAIPAFHLSESSVPPPPPPLPRPMGPASLGEYGGESVYLPSLPGASRDTSQPPPESSHHDISLHQAPIVVTREIRLDDAPPSVMGAVQKAAPPPLPPLIGTESSVVLPSEFPTMEMPVNTLLRPMRSASSFGPASSSGLPGAPSENSDFEVGQRRSQAFQRPETTPGTSWEHILEWYNQFSWAPWTSDELAKTYYRPGIQVGWESLALQDIAKVWNTWRNGCVPLGLPANGVDLHAFEGFLRCETLGVLRQQGFPDLHSLSKHPEGDPWLSVYREIRGRMRGGDAIFKRCEDGAVFSEPTLGLWGRPDRLAELHGESDVIAIVTPFSVSEGLNWTGVYAVAQYRIAQAMGIPVSGVPVAVHLTMPIWDERKQCRMVSVEDVGSENRRMEVALERFRRVLSGQAPPRPQGQASTCSGCGWRHWCPNYTGARPRLNLASPPPQVAAVLR